MTPKQFYTECRNRHYESDRRRGFAWGPYRGTTIYGGMYEQYGEHGPTMCKALVRVDGQTFGAVNLTPDSPYDVEAADNFIWLNGEQPPKKWLMKVALYS